MVIASDFERRTYKSLFLRFGWQFLLFVIGLLVSSGIMYGIEKNYAFEDHHEDPFSYQEDFGHEVESFLNSTGFSAIEEFSKTHDVHSVKIKDLVRELAKMAYHRNAYNDTHSETYYENIAGGGMTFLEAMTLVFSVITTVGWGHVTPATIGGQAFTCVLAIIGIPLTFIMIVSGSQIIIRLSKHIIHKNFGLISRVNLLYKPFIVVVIFIYVATTSGIIGVIELFDYRSALWYSIMSLTTVGFGDVVQYSTIHYGREAHAAGVLIFQILWLIVGFILIGAFVLGVVYDYWGDPRSTQFHQILKNKNNEELVENEDE